MDVFFINLEADSERRRHTLHNLKNCGFDNIYRFTAIEPKDLYLHKNSYDKDFKYKDGTLACGLSHIALLKHIVDLGLTEPVLIIEDDILLKRSAKSIIFLLKNFLNDYDPDWNILYIGWSLGSNVNELWEGQAPLKVKNNSIFDWDKIGQLIDFYFIRKIKKYSKVIRFYEWSDIYIKWLNEDIYKYKTFQQLFNQSAYIVNPLKLKSLIDAIIPLDKAIDIKILENFNKINIYMLSPSFEIVEPNPITCKNSVRLNNDYKKDIAFVWPKSEDVLNPIYDYEFKIRLHKSLIYNEDHFFIRKKSKIFLNNNEIFVELRINNLNEEDVDYSEISFTLDKKLLSSLPKDNNIIFSFETFWKKDTLQASVVFKIL